MSVPHDANPVPLIFGEVLYDVFPGGEEVLGGAAFNAAWNLQGLGLAPLFLSRVGRDERGERVLEAMKAWGMNIDCVQVDPERPTGIVDVTVQNGQPTYTIVADQAYDRIDGEEAASWIDRVRPALLYHGTLALRSEVSRNAATALRHSRRAPLFIDVNLRAPWWSRDQVETFLTGAAWAKLNDDEVTALSPQETGAGAAAAKLRERLGIDHLVVTHGEHGATHYVQDGRVLEVLASPVGCVADTVGAGDAFSAVLMLGQLRGWEPGETLARAADYAASVCSRRGATSPDASLYEPWRKRWQ